jgi:hypothetical protein
VTPAITVAALGDVKRKRDIHIAGNHRVATAMR